MAKDARAFIDKDRKVMNAYYDLCDSYDSDDCDYPSAEKRLRELINEDPDFLDPYLTLREIFLGKGNDAEAGRLLNDAYERATKLITAEDGKWPDELLWGYLGNRHIIRTLFAKAEDLWETGHNEEAGGIFRGLLRTNPNDNIGARYYVLGINLGMDHDEFRERFLGEADIHGDKVSYWFYENSPLFPEDFAAAWEEEEDFEE
jgi:tetratricopeptide (TPR) repeat protein